MRIHVDPTTILFNRGLEGSSTPGMSSLHVRVKRACCSSSTIYGVGILGLLRFTRPNAEWGARRREGEKEWPIPFFSRGSQYKRESCRTFANTLSRRQRLS